MQVNTNPQKVRIDPISAGVIRIEMAFAGTVAAVGSAFLWRKLNKLALVTAWHNLTGTHPHSGQPISPTGVRPDSLRLNLLLPSIGQHKVIERNLYDAEGRANWRIHPVVGEQVDVAIMDLTDDLTKNWLGIPLNEVETHNLTTPVGTEIFIVGFPLGISGIGFPIWKRGSIASEPELFADEVGRRRLLVDSATRNGMSGAPVVARSVGGYVDEDGSSSLGSGVYQRIVGLYSGRMASQDQLDAQIGIVWPRQLIERIFNSGVRDTFTRDGSFSAREPDIKESRAVTEGTNIIGPTAKLGSSTLRGASDHLWLSEIPLQSKLGLVQSVSKPPKTEGEQ